MREERGGLGEDREGEGGREMEGEREGGRERDGSRVGEGAKISFCFATAHALPSPTLALTNSSSPKLAKAPGDKGEQE